MNYACVEGSIEDLIDNLKRVDTEYSYHQKYIGEAISYLRLLYDLTSHVSQQPVHVVVNQKEKIADEIIAVAKKHGYTVCKTKNGYELLSSDNSYTTNGV